MIPKILIKIATGGAIYAGAIVYKKLEGNGILSKAQDTVMDKLNEKLKKSQKTVTIVYDGDSPYISARNLYEYLKEMGQTVKFIDKDEYKKGSWGISYGKVIIVGHHSLAKDELKSIGAFKYDVYGMKFGFSSNQCVLRASRSELGHGKKGRKLFSDYYNSRILAYEELANKFGIPMEYGYRVQTRDSQYDLLLLEFIQYGLSEFLGPKDMISPIKNEESENTNNIEDIAADLKEQMDADKDVTISVDEILTNIYKQNENAGMQTLRKHLGNDIIFTGVWTDVADEHQLDDEELFPGELSAAVFTVGCYAVRSAQRVYKKTDGSEEVPADKEELEQIKNSNSILGFADYKENLRMTHEITARHNSDPEGVFSGNFKYICRATHGRSWYESIDFICSVKKDSLTSDEYSSLFVLNTYMGDSFSVEDWYKLVPSGEVTTYQIHPYNDESYEASWKDN